MPAPKFDSVRAEYARLWSSMTINPSRVASFKKIADRLMKGMPRYRKVEEATGVPAVMIAILHLRESDADFDTYLGNGQPLDRVTTIVPKGRGPFRNFEEGAIDALAIDGLSKIKDWSLELVLFKAEAFNGFGYRFKGLRSPYLWGGTSHQQPGKYVRDGVFDPSVMDLQLGAAGVLFTLFMIDPELTIRLGAPAKPPQRPAERPPAPEAAFSAPRPPSPPAAKPGAKEAALGVGALIATAAAWISENPWLLIGGGLLIAAGFVGYLIVKKG